MALNQKTLDEQLAEARAKKAQLAVRLDQLETRRKHRDARMRAWGEKVLVSVVLNAAASEVSYKAMLEDLLAKAELRSKDKEAALWLIGTLEPKRPAATNGGGAAHQAPAAAPLPEPQIT